MYIKKLVTLALSIVMVTAINAQTTSTDWGWDWADTSKVPTASMPQHTEFLNNQFIYPAKPRNMWELGLGIGGAYIFGDVAGKMAFGGTISFRKAINNSWSIRMGLTGLLPRGVASPYGIAVGQVDYKNRTHQLGIDAIYSLNAASHYRGNPKTNVYVLAGYSLNAARVEYRGLPGAQPGGYNIFYGYNNTRVFPNSQSGLIGTFGAAEINGRKGFSLFHGLNLGTGIAFKLNNRVNLGIEQKFTFTAPGYDFLDAWKADGPGENNFNDFYSFTSFRVNINLGNAAKRVQPLWWLNPYNYIYSELNVPKHMKLPPVVLPDGDGDGVTDQFDLEPNTPKGCPVDTHGVTKDTDGDGVPDCRDKEILTQLKCFPVNSDGVGTCPEPACCKEIRDMMANQQVTQPVAQCTIGSLPSVQFANRSAKLSRTAENVLASAAATIIANPKCNIRVIGYGASSKAAQQMSWERVNAVIKYLTEKQGIAESRLLFQYGQDGDANTVDLQGTTETGPTMVPAPHPNLRSRN
jgi:OOP family OmpA-OmpF porin